MYALKDMQIPGRYFGGDEPNTFARKGDAHDILVSFHSVDWEENPPIEECSTKYLLEYGGWELVKVDGRKHPFRRGY